MFEIHFPPPTTRRVRCEPRSGAKTRAVTAYAALCTERQKPIPRLRAGADLSYADVPEVGSVASGTSSSNPASSSGESAANSEIGSTQETSARVDRQQRRRAMPEAGLSPSSMDNWKAGIRDRLLRELSRNGDPGVQTTRKPGECRIRAPLDLRRRNPLSLKQPSAKRTVDQQGTVSSCAAALDPQRALKEWLPS
jgi:hypothetical protein